MFGRIEAKAKKSKARAGRFTTAHGNLATPELAFVATEGELKAVPKEVLSKLPVKLIIVNTFHLWTKKILEKQTVDDGRSKVDIESGPSGIHNFTGFPRPIMSDSGGFQVFSMGFGKTHGVGKIANIFPEEKTFHQPENQPARLTIGASDRDNPLKITDRGVTFPWEGKNVTLTPELSIEIQKSIGADIIFAFDECTSPLNSYEYTKEALGKTHRWLKRCIKEFNKTVDGRRLKVDIEDRSLKVEKNLSSTLHPLPSRHQALFAIVQGGYFKDLRVRSATFMAKQDVAGFGIGGSLGRSKEHMHQVLEWIIPHLPEGKPRHLLGIGQVRDIFESVERGVDLFDCVIPTREARHRVLYTKQGKIQVRKMRNSGKVAEPDCRCEMCTTNITLKKLNTFFSGKDPRAFYFATVHNIRFFTDLTATIRRSIKNGTFSKLKNRYLAYYP